MMQLHAYDPANRYDEMFETVGRPRRGTELLVKRLSGLAPAELAEHQQAATVALRNMGITFNVYGHESGTEKVWPFDIIPRIVAAREWEQIERGLKQRIQALNLFLCDVYGEQRILKDGIVPTDLVLSADAYRPQCMGFRPPHGVYCHVTGTDLVRDKDGKVYVLEDNLRVPSGVSYVLENRAIMKRTFPQVFEGLRVRPVEDYPERLLETLFHVAPEGVDRPCAVVLTPGPYNSAYFEHSFLAQQMGIELVQPGDLVVTDGLVHMRTTRGLRRVDVIYRRVDDDYLDPKVFRPESLLGVPGLMDVYRRGKVTLVNAPGGGVADDKAVYAFVPDMIRFYLAEEPILNNVPTYVGLRENDLRYILEHIDELVVKAVNESGGYGMLIGPHASQAERAQFRERVRANPRNYIAQPTLALSRHPTLLDETLYGCHIDLRPYTLFGEKVTLVPGGLTRVALRKGSLVVNSSQGGGSKDTWVLRE